MRSLGSWVRIALLLLAVQSVASYPKYPSITNKTFIKQYIDAHNKFRSEVNPSASNMLYMTFDLGLAKLAHAWVKKCIFGHNPKDTDHPDPKFRPFGENIYYEGFNRKQFNTFAAIHAFHQEVKYYTYDSHKCSDVCGHYTQVVWATTYKVGCAVLVCPSVRGRYKSPTTVMVCTYAPPGNYRGARPYKKGKSCSECPKGNTCKNKLCRNAEREKENNDRYSAWYPPYQTWNTCEEGCIAAIVLRLSFLLLTFPAAYYLKQRFSDLSIDDS